MNTHTEIKEANQLYNESKKNVSEFKVGFTGNGVGWGVKNAVLL